MPDFFVCVHGHFYQPPRYDPFTGAIAVEAAAAPYHDFNEKIWDECYRSNAAASNFTRMSFDLGPTLASWLASAHPDTLRTIVDSAKAVRAINGHGNALAHSYHHTILPLATPREVRLQIAWGVRDFRRRFGYMPAGMWLPETAVDMTTAEELARQGLAFIVLAPWQADRPGFDPTVPYRVALPSGRSLAAFFYNSTLSGNVSFNDDTTADAARFCAQDVAAEVARAPLTGGGPRIILVATDGELYGHHKRFRDLFLSRLLTVEVEAADYGVTSLESFLSLRPPTETTDIRQVTSWSCAHGIARWDQGCSCTAGDSSWKGPLRQALRALAARLDDIFELEAGCLLGDPWLALEEYVDLRDRAVAPEDFWARHLVRGTDVTEHDRLRGLMEMQFARQAMFVSCAWFFEDLDRLEPRIALNHARYAVYLAARHASANLAPAFLHDLGLSSSVRTGRTAADMYRELEARA